MSHDWRNPDTCQCGEAGCASRRPKPVLYEQQYPARRRGRGVARKNPDVTAKNANPKGPVKCFNCGSFHGEWVAVDLNRYVGACTSCFDTAVYWAALCNLCGTPRYEHTGDEKTECPLTARLERLHEVSGAMPIIVYPPQKEIASAEPEIIDAEVVELEDDDA